MVIMVGKDFIGIEILKKYLSGQKGRKAIVGSEY